MSWCIALNCTFTMQEFSPIGSIYTCQAGILFRGNDTVTDIYRIHWTDKTDADVHGIAIQSQGLQFFPINIEAYFPNIIAFDVYSNLIPSISNSHLQSFTDLVHFSVVDNQIQSLDSDLFSGLPALSYISFNNNSIQNVGHDFILPSSGQIFLDNNDCIHQAAVNATEIIDLKFNLLRQCPPSISQIEKSLEDRQNLLSNVYKEVRSLEVRVAQLELAIELLLATPVSKNKH